MSLPAPHRPALARAADLWDRLGRGLGLRRDWLTPEALEEDAARMTGLSDFGPDDYREGLEVFCRSLARDAHLDVVGRAVVRSFLRRILGNRLLLVEHRKHAPAPVELVRPLIVMGLPRTGTTHLHRLLAQDPAAHGPPAWTLWRPLPRLEGPDRRREITIQALEGMRTLSPELDSKHYQEADEPEECYHLLDPSFRAPGLTMLCQARSYWEWVRGQDMRPAYRMYREYLEILQASAPGKRLTLKTPLHTPYLEEILEVIPDACFVQTHRDVVEVAGSMASLAHSMFAVTSPRVDPIQLGELVMDLLRWLAEATLAQREARELPVVDVAYRDLLADPVGTVGRIHEVHGLPFTAEVEAAVRAGAERRPQHRKGTHRYELADFGLSEARVREALAPYVERFLGA
ncbi:MAG: sulfotransferase [Deltaproteobacteria bacterium]|nr:sulfotransferase [Deltaproteobacteria bacterium]